MGGTLLGNGKSLGNENENTGCDVLYHLLHSKFETQIYFKILREILHNCFFLAKGILLKCHCCSILNLCTK
jgi:hypothetical protein